MRNWLNDARSYMRPIDIGEPMRAAGIGRVVGSKSKKFVPGDLVSISRSPSRILFSCLYQELSTTIL
jgi:NADPH-dependent curcumin reductase CurA